MMNKELVKHSIRERSKSLEKLDLIFQKFKTILFAYVIALTVLWACVTVLSSFFETMIFVIPFLENIFF